MFANHNHHRRTSQLPRVVRFSCLALSIHNPADSPRPSAIERAVLQLATAKDYRVRGDMATRFKGVSEDVRKQMSAGHGSIVDFDVRTDNLSDARQSQSHCRICFRASLLSVDSALLISLQDDLDRPLVEFRGSTAMALEPAEAKLRVMLEDAVSRLRARVADGDANLTSS